MYLVKVLDSWMYDEQADVDTETEFLYDGTYEELTELQKQFGTETWADKYHIEHLRYIYFKEYEPPKVMKTIPDDLYRQNRQGWVKDDMDYYVPVSPVTEFVDEPPFKLPWEEEEVPF